MAAKPSPPTPPRLTGNPKADNDAHKHYLNALFQNAVKDTRLLDPSKQFVPDAFDPDNLPDPTDSSIANAQKTANEAYANGAAKAAEALQVAQEGIAALALDIENEVTARTDADTTLTTNLAAEVVARSLLAGRMLIAENDINTAQDDIDTAQGDIAQLQARVPFFHGTITIAGASTTGATAAYTNTGSATVRGCFTPRTGTPTRADLSHVVKGVSYGPTSTTITVAAAPGVGESITFDAILFKAF